jgi:hypothetical protein
MEKRKDLVGAIVLSGCHRFYAWSAAVMLYGRSTRKTYVKERLCGSIFLQVHLVHVFQTFDRHGDVGSMVPSSLM